MTLPKRKSRQIANNNQNDNNQNRTLGTIESNNIFASSGVGWKYWTASEQKFVSENSDLNHTNYDPKKMVNKVVTTSQSHGGALYYVVEVPRLDYDQDFKRRFR